MGNYKDYVSPVVIARVKKINEVGVKELLRYYDKYKPKSNFRRQLLIVRTVARKGYATAGRELGMSYQATELALKRMYEIALEVEALNNGKIHPAG